MENAESVTAKPSRPSRIKTAGGAEPQACPHCHLWANGPADTYCSFCGHLLLDLRLSPERPLLISGKVEQREIVIRNGGPRPLTALLVAVGRPLPGLIVEPATAFDVAVGEEAKLLLRLDAKQLRRDLVVEELAYALMIDGDPRQMVPVPITVKAGPRPLLSPPALHFGDLAEGKKAVQPLELRNAGGIPLSLREVRVEGSEQLALLGKPAFPRVIGPGERLSLSVEWDARRGGKTPAAAATGLRFTFDNYAESLFVPATVRLFRFALAFDRPALRLAPALSKQDYIQNVTVTNIGTIDVEIAGIESDQPWIEVVANARSFTLRAAGADPAGGAGEAFTFTVVCHPQKLREGPNKGTVTVIPVGQARLTLPVELDVVRPQESANYLAIDFGTSNSVISFYNERTKAPDVVEIPDPIAVNRLTALIPSVLAFVGGPATYKIGHEALSEFRVFPERGVRSIKRIMGYANEWEFYGQKFSPDKLASLIIEKLVQLAEEQYFRASGKYLTFKKAIVTVPANFFDLQIRDVVEACAQAGLDTEEEAAREAAVRFRETIGREVNAGIILDEPSAAALYYLEHLEDLRLLDRLVSGEVSEQNLLVFDHGGGTLDVSVANVIRLEQGGYGLRVLANMGNNRVGGESLDILLMQELLRRCKGENPAFEESLIAAFHNELETRARSEGWRDGDFWREVLAARAAWKDTAEAAKIELSTQEETRLSVGAVHILVRPGASGLASGPAATVRPFSTVIKRADFENLIEGTLVQCDQLVIAALKLARLAPEQIDFVLHTGRQSLMPEIQARVRTRFPELPPGNIRLDPEHVKLCVAKGAALYGLQKKGLMAEEGAGVQFLNEGRRLPHSYGVEKKVGLTQRELDVIVPLGETYPRAEKRHIPPNRIDASGWLSLKFYQNTGTRKVIRNNPEITQIGQITVNTLADGTPGADVLLLIDANRKLEVSVDGEPVKIEPVRLQGEESWMG